MRRLAPGSLRRVYRFARREGLTRLRDAVPDFLDRLRSEGERLPPARLRGTVGRASSREEYRHAGEQAFDELHRSFREARAVEGSYLAWLDFGCGAGRIARHVLLGAEVPDLTGVDVDADAVAWCVAHLRGTYLSISPEPPLPFPGERFDVVYVASVFTHFTEEEQLLWLAELCRVLRHGGLLLASTHAPEVAEMRPEMTFEQRKRLSDYGFEVVEGDGSFKERAAFHSRSYLERVWTKHFECVSFAPKGLFNFQDLGVWRKPPSAQVHSMTGDEQEVASS